jgi:hypothetical protein
MSEWVGTADEDNVPRGYDKNGGFGKSNSRNFLKSFVEQFFEQLLGAV